MLAASMLPNLDFESKDPGEGWRLRENWSLAAGVGRNGSTALMWENHDPAKYTFPVRSFEIDQGGANYRFGGWVKVIEGEDLKPVIAIDWSDANGKWCGSRGAIAVVDNDPNKAGWTRYELVSGILPTNAVHGNLLCYLPRKSTGKVLFDDFKLERVAIDPVECLACSAYKATFTAADGQIRFGAVLNLNTVVNRLSDYSAEFELKGADGKTRTLPIAKLKETGVSFSVGADKFALGDQTVALRLKLKGEVVGERTLPVTRLTQLPTRHVAIDRHGRALLDGKPFFPLGMYVSAAMSDEDFAIWKKSPFNFATVYGGTTAAQLDKWRDAHTHIAVDVRSLIYGYNYSAQSQLKTLEDSQAAFRAKFAEYGRHPNLFAWYLVDEAPLEFVPNVAAVNAFLREADPDHPTYTVTDKPYDVHSLLPCFDAIGMDPYPIGNSGVRSDIASCSEWAWGAKRDTFGLRPMWHVPQYFSWSWYRLNEANPEMLRMPTLAELKNMTWQGIAGGANGICGYAFHSMRKNLKGEAFDRAWADVVAAATEVKSMEAVLLSAGKTLALEKVPEDLAVRAYRHEGRDYLLIVSRRTKPVRATLALPRRYAALKTELGAGVTLEGDALKVDFDGLGYAFVSLLADRPVDPFIGTAGTGHCTPAAAYPFGMVQPGADTGNEGWEHCSGYEYGDDRIVMFSNTHLNGTGSSGLGDVGFFPFAGAAPAAPGSSFSHERETAEPGYYSVCLDDTGVKAECTCTERVALHRLTGEKEIGFFLDANYGIHSRVERAKVTIESDRRVTGEVSQLGWVDRTFYFALESDQPLEFNELPLKAGEKTPVIVCRSASKELNLKVAVSAKSVEGAKRNLATCREGFDETRAKAALAWERIFARLNPPVEHRHDVMLYTSMYRLCFQPNLISDEGEEKRYTTFSLWDTYRAAHPLYTRLLPEMVPPFVNSLLDQGEATGFMPIWALWGIDNQGMIGVHSVPVVADAFLKGFGGVDWERAYRQIRDTLTRTEGTVPKKSRWELLEKYGYYPCDIIKGEGVSRLLESTFDFWCAAKMAERLGKREDAEMFLAKSRLWTNVYDRASGFMRGRDSKGDWREMFNPQAVGHNTDTDNDFTEGNAYQWNWHVLHDPKGLIAAMGGEAAAERKLDELFAADSSISGECTLDVTGMIGQYAHGNEPSHHIPYLYSLLGKPEKTARIVGEILERFYRPTPDGLAGNDDCGQMSAWYIYAVLGGYPLTPCGEGGDLAEYVDPFIGTTATGHTFPGACVPLGMVQASPDTGTEHWDYCSGYRHDDPELRGFSHTHLNGTGGADLGDILILPFVGEKTDFKEAIDKASEKASPGAYEVRLATSDIFAEVSATEHAAIYRFTYRGAGKARMMVDCQWGIVGAGALAGYVLDERSQVEGPYVLSGWKRTKYWNLRETGFVLEFDRPFRVSSHEGRRYVLDFDLAPCEALGVKVGLSRNGADAAKRNLAAEIPGWDLASVRREARDAWNRVLGVAEVEGAEAEKRSWYTAMYHLYIQPNNIADVGEKPFYSTFSCWDTFRAAGPLYTILTPSRASDFVDSMLAQGRKTGYLPIWTLWGEENQCMIGTHSIPMIVDAALKGTWRGDLEGAYAQIRDSLTAKHEGREKEDWAVYDKFGYYPFDIIRGESVSRTMECAYDDWCAAKLAERLGKREDAALFMKRAGYWKNVFDPSLGLVRGRDSRGRWREPFDPFTLGHGAEKANDFTEGNAFQYTWHVMQDVDGLVAALGGRDRFAARLDSLFTQPTQTEGMGKLVDITGLIGQYVHGNEPSHHVIYFYPQVGRPEKAAERIREVFDRFYLAKPDGLCGNDDCGQMSAWYLFSAMGFYPFNPCGGEYVIGAPQLPRVTLRLENGKTFTMVANGLSRENKYVKSVSLNGRPLKGCTLSHADILAGGELVFEMAASAENSAPADELAGQKIEGELPIAPAGYRRPKDWRPVLYPRDLATLAKEESAGQMARAKQLMERVDATNREGKWHADAESIDRHQCPEWFVDAKLGIFIDWGPWSLASWCPYKEGARLYPDWYEKRCMDEPTHQAYHAKNWGADFKRDHFLDLFRAEKFDAPAMMKVFRECGAKYVVPFLKHHGGYCLWDSSYTFRDAVDQGPRRDLAKEMVDACRANGLKFGVYASQAGEWEYPILQEDGSIRMFVESKPELRPYSPEMEWKASGKVPVRDFVREYIVPQTVEFIDKYDPDIFWGDYDWTSDAAKNGSYDIAAYLYNHAEGRKEVAVNDRLGCGTPEEVAAWSKVRQRLIGMRTLRGDYYTDEWGDTAADIDPKKWHPWESCSGISKAYGNHWMESEDMVMTEKEFICHFADIVSRGGNLLLLVNLDAQGAMVEHQRKRLMQIGEWLKANGEAIYATRIVAPFCTETVDYTRSKDGRAVYAIVKRLSRQVTLECSLPGEVAVTDVATGRRLAARREGQSLFVELDDATVKRDLPVALKCTVL